MSAPPLAELQSWFLTLMTAPGGVAQGQALAAGRSALQLEQVVAHQRGIAPARRMHIYAQGYVLRLLECLRADYPWLLRIMGEDLFSFFARAYIWHHPSRSPTLYDLGARFADFLAASQAGPANDDGLLALPVALARLERARVEASRAPGTEQLQPAPGEPLAALLMGQQMLLQAPACLRLLELDLALLPFVQALAQDDVVPAPPARARCQIGVTRQHYRVRMHALEPWQFQLLTLLTQAGEPLAVHACVGELAGVRCELSDGLPAELLAWLPGASAHGLLQILPDA